MKKILLFLIASMLLLSFSFVSATQTVSPNFPSGYNILEQIQNTLKMDTDYDYSFYLLNYSNGVEITNTSTSCYFVMSDYTGKVLALGNVSYYPEGYWNYHITASNFSYAGNYPYGVKCLDGTVGGALSGNFYVNGIGNELTIGKAILYILLLIVCFILFFGLIALGIFIPYKNKSDELTGYIIAVSTIKYLKIFCLAMSYVIAVFISYLVWIISYSYLEMSFLSEIFRFLFNSLAILSLPIFILFVYITIANLVRDSQISEALTRGFQVNGKE